MGTYRHTQVSHATVLIMGIAAVTLAWWGVRMSDPPSILMAVFVGLALIIFSSLTVIVGDGMMDVFFGPGLIRRRIELRRIRDVRVVTTPWYYGWGIRLTPSGWLWNVSGLRGVELVFDDGRYFRVGSDEPDRLAAALRRAIGLDERAARV